MRKERRTGGFNAEVGGRKRRFGLADIRPLIEQFRRQSGRHPRHGDLGRSPAVHLEIRRRARHQHGERGHILAQRHLDRRDRRALGRNQCFLLRQIELRCGAAVELLLDQGENALGGRQVAARHAQLILRRQDLEIGVGDGHDRRQGHDIAVVAGSGGALLGGIQRCAVLAPEIQHVARSETDTILGGRD